MKTKNKQNELGQDQAVLTSCLVHNPIYINLLDCKTVTARKAEKYNCLLCKYWPDLYWRQIIDLGQAWEKNSSLFFAQAHPRWMIHLQYKSSHCIRLK